jgi:hypothetical protein
MRCDDIRDHLMDVGATDLTSPEPRVREHLRDCERCRKELAGATQAWSLLTAIPDEAPDSAAMRREFAGILRSFRETSVDAVVSPPWWASVRSPAWLSLRVAAAMLFALLAGGLVGRQFSVPETSDERALGEVREELRDVREMLALSLLQHGIASNRIKGASSAAQLADPRADVLDALVDALLHDPNVNVRLASVRALERFNGRQSIRDGVAQALRNEQSPLVTMSLISYVVEAKDVTAIEALRSVSEDRERDAGVREMAAQGIARLLGGGRI